MINGWASHQPVLYDAIKRTKKPILELGAGEFSTQQIHDLAMELGLSILTIDGYQEWLDKYLAMESYSHGFLCVPPDEMEEFFLRDVVMWGVVFIDYGTWEQRVNAMNHYKNKADYLVMHDCDYFPHNGMFGVEIEPLDNLEVKTGLRDYSDTFKWWIEFFIEGWEKYIPPTLLASNRINLNDITIEGMIISGRNK